MIKLLNAGLWRYLKSPIVWISALAAVLSGLWVGDRIRWHAYVDSLYLLIPEVILAVLLSLMIGREFSDGAIRNKLVAGHAKGKIFLAELLLGLLMCAGLFLLFFGSVVLCNAPLCALIPHGVAGKLFWGFLLAALVSATIRVLVSMLITSRTVASIVNLLLIVALALVAGHAATELNQSEYHTQTGFVYNEEKDSYDRVEERILNADYPRGVRRKLYEFAQQTLPFGQNDTFASVINEYAMAWAERPATLSEKQEAALDTAPYRSIGALAVLTAFGWAVFRKKELK